MSRLIEGVKYPENLLSEIFGGDVPTERPLDFAGTLEYVLYTVLSERECKMIHMRYVDGMTLDELAQEHGVTRERVRQVLAKAERKLRHPRIIKKLTLGLEAVKALAIDAAIQQAQERVEQVTAQKIRERVREAINEVFTGSAYDTEAQAETPIEQLDLSVRSYNCMKRAGYRTLADCVGLTQSKLMGVRNLGRKSSEEIVEKLGAVGIYVREDTCENDT